MFLVPFVHVPVCVPFCVRLSDSCVLCVSRVRFSVLWGLDWCSCPVYDHVAFVPEWLCHPGPCRLKSVWLHLEKSHERRECVCPCVFGVCTVCVFDTLPAMNFALSTYKHISKNSAWGNVFINLAAENAMALAFWGNQRESLSSRIIAKNKPPLEACCQIEEENHWGGKKKTTFA